MFRANWQDYDVVHAVPPRLSRKRQALPGRFDTVIVNEGHGGLVSAEGKAFAVDKFKLLTRSLGYQIGRVRVIFALPDDVAQQLEIDSNSSNTVPPYLAYVEWFTGLQNGVNPNHRMFSVKQKLSSATGKRIASVIPLSDIRRSVHLLPKFGPVTPRGWTSENVLDMCKTFYVNCFTDRHLYGTFF